MPDTWLRWGTDGNGDGIADPWNPEDAVYAAARYLAAAEGRTDISRAIFAYNHAQWYVDDVLELAALFGGGAATRRRLHARPDRRSRSRRRRSRSRRSARRSRAAEARESELPRRADAARRGGQEPRRCCSPTGSSRRRTAFEVEQERARGERRGRAAPRRARAPRRRSRPRGAAPTPRRSCRRPPACSACRAARTATSSRSAAARRLVSVGHDHHDYPAADIAAPLGAPVYALADAVVLEPRRRRPLRHRPHAPHARRPRVGLLPPLLPRQRRPARRVPHRRAVGRARRLDRPLDRPAPPSRPQAGPLSAGDAVVPGVRGRRLHLAGRGELRRTRCRARSSRQFRRARIPRIDVVEFTLTGA